MSTALHSPSLLTSGPRKRTSSFSVPRPAKRMTLRRTESFITLPGLENGLRSPSHTPEPPALPYHRTLRYYKEQRERRKIHLNRSQSQPLITFSPSPSPPSSATTSKGVVSRASSLQPKVSSPQPRASSPLAPTRTTLPPRASFPRSKPEPNLYRMAITTRMKCTPEGQKIIHMGPRLALSILTATRELERIVAAQMEVDNDVAMSDGALSNSWVVVPGEDWEMVDCGA